MGLPRQDPGHRVRAGGTAKIRAPGRPDWAAQRKLPSPLFSCQGPLVLCRAAAADGLEQSGRCSESGSSLAVRRTKLLLRAKDKTI